MTQLTTRAVAQWLGKTEPQIADLVRRGKIQPAPTIIAGRRFWSAAQARQAAQALGLLTPRNEQLLAEIVEVRQ